MAARTPSCRWYLSVHAVIFAMQAAQRAPLHGTGEMSEFHTGRLQLAVDLDAEQFARRDLDRLAPRPDHGPATRRLHAQDAFLPQVQSVPYSRAIGALKLQGVPYTRA